ncbi:MAG: hypothetical protein HY903_11545 [Deltaproteobacteria bacterium]|nr:hypothetical protein [Deltaproteobacteria bacterium]
MSAAYGAPREVGQFGDLFGGLTAIFSGLAFVGVVVALLYQSRQLELQREDLKVAHKSLATQIEEQREARKEMETQGRFQAYLALANFATVIQDARARLRGLQGFTQEEAGFTQGQLAVTTLVRFLQEQLERERSLTRHMVAEGYLEPPKKEDHTDGT